MDINDYSDVEKAQENAKRYLGKDTILYRSTRKNKKFMVHNKVNQFVHFGQMGYEDFTYHQDKIRQKNYLTRATHLRGNWKSNKYSPNNLSIHILWQ
jgi:hypothetical protein